jgi:hypothetical protein
MTLAEIQQRFTDQLREVDDVAQIVLKGHLVMEGLMTEAIETFLLHGEFIETAGLRFHQKIAFCRAISTSEQNNRMWDLVSSINALRNALSHSLDSDRRSKAIRTLRAIYEAEFKDLPNSTRGIPNDIEKDAPADMVLCLYAISGALGYLHAHLEEVKRLKSIVVGIDEVMNNGALRKQKVSAPSTEKLGK